MFSNSFKNKIIQKYNISESIINRPIHYRIPDIVNIKFKKYPLYYSSKKLNESKTTENNKISTFSSLSPKQKDIYDNNKDNQKYRKKLELLLNEENPINTELIKNYQKSIKMIYEIKKFPNIANRAVIKDMINKKNHKKSTIFPKVCRNLKLSQNLPNANNNLISLNKFFTPQLTKIRIKNKHKIRNLNEFPLKERDTEDSKEKEIIIQEKPISRDKQSIKLIKTKEQTTQTINIKENNRKKNYSYYDSPIKVIKSRYFNFNTNTNSINEKNNDDEI